MKKITVLIDGFNLYHATHALKDDSLKWTNPRLVVENFIHKTEEVIHRIVFFTAFPHHTPKEVQARYLAYTAALRHYGVEVVEGKFKKKIITFKKGGQNYTRTTHEEKETDVNLALAILEDAYEKASDKILVVTNDSDIAPAIRMARKKQPHLPISVITPPLIKTKHANYDLMDACGAVNRNKRGQVYFKTRGIKEQHLRFARMPDTITLADGTIITMPAKYK